MSIIEKSVSPIDENHLLYGNFIGLQYVFETGLDVEVLAKSVAALVRQFPALSSYYQAKSASLRSTSKPVALKRQTAKTTVADVLISDTRPHFVEQPARKDVLRGKAQLSTFTLTECAGGGVIFGMAISHVLTDAAGYHLLIGHLSEIYSALQSGTMNPEFPFTTYLTAFDFGTSRTKTETLIALKRRGLPKLIPIKGLLGGLVKSLIIKAMDRSLADNPPVRLTLSAEEVAQLKTSVLRESGEEWISTNVALCAHFTSLMAELSYGNDLKTEVQIGQLLDLRNRYFETDVNSQSIYVGNAILIHIDRATFPLGLQKTTRGALACYFKQRQAQTDMTDVKDRLDLLSDCLTHGYTNPELDVKNPIISLNNQSKMPVYDISFGDQKPARIFPQDVGDNIMFFPAPDGGIEIYIRDIVNPGRQKKLLTPDWKTRIYNV